MGREKIVFVRVIRAWWKDLNTKPRHRGTLGRAVDLGAVQYLSAFDELKQRLAGMDIEYDDDGLACAAAVLSHVHQDAEGNLGTHFGRRRNGASLVSAERFARVTEARDHHELYAALRRIFATVGREAPVSDIINVVTWWGPEQRDKLRTRYEVASAGLKHAGAI